MATRKRKAVGVGLLLAILLIGWKGLGWLEGNPDADGDGEGAREAQPLAGGARAAGPTAAEDGERTPPASGAGGGSEATVVTPGAEESSTTPSRPGEGPATTEPSGPVPGEPSAEPASDVDSTAGAAGGGGIFIADRAEGLLDVVRRSAESGRIAEGYVAADALGAMDLAPDWRARHRAALESLTAAREEQLEALAEALQRADGVAARGLAEPLWRPPHPALRAAIQSFCAGRAWPELRGPDETISSGADEEIAVDRLASRRTVLWHGGGEPVRARVIGGSGPTVSLEVFRRGQVTYPIAPRTAVVPVDPTPEELVQQGLAHCAAGERHVARLWWLAAQMKGAQGAEFERLGAAVAGR